MNHGAVSIRPRPTRGRVAALAVVALLASAGCRTVIGPTGELQEARSRWEARAPASYRIVVQPQCFCGTEVTSPAVVTVRAGQVESRVYEASGEPVSPPWISSFPSVDGLFGIIADALERDAARITATYHPVYGYPTSLFIDYRAGTADDEITYLVRSFQPL